MSTAVTYDTIVIGAGLSGLAAGIRLAYFEKSVCVLERHTTIGGLNSFYRLRDRNYDVGLHAMTNFATPGTKRGPLSKLLRQLRLRWEDFDLSPQNGSTIAFPGAQLQFTNDFNVLESEIAREFPSQIDGFRRFVSSMLDFDELALDQPDLGARSMLAMHISEPMLIEMLLCPLMFYGSARPMDMDFGQFVIMFKSIFMEGFGRPHAGVRLILKKLVRQFKSLGGELRLRAGVRQIVLDGGRAVGVILDDGTELAARNILSSAGSAETMQLVPADHVLPTGIEPGDISFMETISIVDRQPAELGNDRTIIFYNDAPDFRYERPAQPIDLRSGIICCPDNFQYDQPLEDSSVRITALADPHYWFGLAEEDYPAMKESWRKKIIDSASRFCPDFRTHIIDTDTFTPRTIKRYTGHLNGCVYGAPRKILDGTTSIENLFLCGTDQGFLGIVGSMLSGISMANLHLLKPDSEVATS